MFWLQNILRFLGLPKSLPPLGLGLVLEFLHIVISRLCWLHGLAFPPCTITVSTVALHSSHGAVTRCPHCILLIYSNIKIRVFELLLLLPTAYYRNSLTNQTCIDGSLYQYISPIYYSCIMC